MTDWFELCVTLCTVSAVKKHYIHCISALSLQDDKDLVHEFVVAEGLICLVKVGAEADQNYQNYILRGTLQKTNSRVVLPWNSQACSFIIVSPSRL